MNKILKYFPWIFLFIPAILLLINIVFWGSTTWGDAPHFYPVELNETFSEPLSWTERGASFGKINLYLWLAPFMLLYGLLYKLFGLSNDTIVALVFYAPSIILSLSGMVFLIKYLKFSVRAIFFASLIYLLNTYYLLVIDGGQVGVLVAYGLFPYLTLSLKKLVDNPAKNSFFFAFLVLVISSIADPRIALICIMLVFLWKLFEFRDLRNLAHLILVALLWIPTASYWLFVILKSESGAIDIGVSQLNLTSILHPLFLFSPHWPGNLFGKVNQPLFYFLGFPLLIFLGFFFQRKRKVFVLVFLFLIFSFLAKGATPPLGNWYNFIVSLPFGFAFRDSSKFFIPVILLSAILIGRTVDIVSSKIQKRSVLFFVFQSAVYIYVIFLTIPALTGNLSFVLSKRYHSDDYQKVYDSLKSERDFFRTVWFPERHFLTFETKQNPALDAYTLVDSYPFASMNASTDWFNFLYSEKFVDWFRVLGIKYLILSDDPRVAKKDESEQKNWNTILNLFSQNKNLEKVDWGVSFPVYKVEGTYPRFYKADKIFAVVGPSIDSTLPAIYFEDGKWDPRVLEGKSPEAVKIYFNGLDKADLTLSFLQKYFMSPSSNSFSQWSVFPTSQYLKSKYELLIRGVEYKDFDYNRGIAFSTQSNEQIRFEFEVPQGGDYILLARLMANNDSLGLKNTETGSIYDMGTVKRDKFVWVSEELGNLKKGKHKVTFQNRGGVTIVNTFALVSKEEFAKAQKLADAFVAHFGVVNTKQLESETYKISNVEIEKFGTLKYKLQPPKDGYWVILNENYHPLWQLRRGIEYFDSVPVYSMVNGFYTDPKWGDLRIEFKGQENVRWGIYFSVVSIFALSIFYLWKKR